LAQKSGIPPTAVGGYLYSAYEFDEPCHQSHQRQLVEFSLATSNKAAMNDPPTAVGGIRKEWLAGQ
jgi:hypothetical protein